MKIQSSFIESRPATRHHANRLAITRLRLPRHITSVAVLSALAAIAPAGAAESSGSLLDDLKFDADIRVRAEWTDNVRDFNSKVNSPDDDGWLITRTRLGLGWKPADWLKFYVQGQDSQEMFSGRPKNTLNGANGNDDFDLRQGYVQIGNFDEFPLELTLGRQSLDLGSRRLVADTRWGNYGRTFDAARVTWKPDKTWTVDVFAANVVNIEEGQFDDSDHNADLTGIFATAKIPGNQSLDLYALHLDSQHSTVAAVKGDFWNLGARLFRDPGTHGPWDYEFEFVVQTGNVMSGKKDLDLLAFGGQATVGYTFDSAFWTPRVSANFSYASGDDNLKDGEQHRLQAMYPSTHALNGLLDAVGWANLLDPYLEFKVSPTKDSSINLQAHAFFRADTADFVYRSNGSSAVRSPAGVNNNSYIGTELDLYYQTNLTKGLELLVGGGVLFAGDYLKTSGPSDNAGTVYTQLTYKY